MKLYSKPGACSTADHIALEWAGADYTVEVMTSEALKSPAYLRINPAGAVPALVDGDFILTQNAAILGYIADTHPQAALAGDGSARQRAEATRWLAFVNADLHPAFVPLFAPAAFGAPDGAPASLRTATLARIRGLLEKADAQLAGKDWLAGFRSFADPYLYMTLRWAGAMGVDLEGLDNLKAFGARMEADPAVRKVLQAEGLPTAG